MNLSKRPANTNVVFEADRAKFLELLHTALRS
jgi:hypothetical protein